MRRALVVAAVALPIAVLAVTAMTGQVIEPNNFNVTAGKSYLNDAACKGNLSLEWSINPVPPAVFTQSGTYLIFASDTAPAPASTGGASFCAEKTTQTPAVNAGQVGSAAASTALQDGTVKGADVVKAVGFSADGTCTASLEGRTLYICTHWTNSQGNARQGVASGTFLVQVLAPKEPSNVTAASGSGKLEVSWTASPRPPPSGFADVDHYIAQATGPDGVVHTSSQTTGTTATVSGLENGVAYTFGVKAFSVGGNESLLASGTGTESPTPSADFWDVYKARGGVEEGGCSVGGAGGLALLGAASLLAVRRRKP